MKIYCNWTSGHVSFISYLGKWSVFLQDFRIFIYGGPVVCLFSYSLPSNMFYWVFFSFYRTPEDRPRLALNLHRWKNDLSWTNCLVCHLFYVQLSSSRCTVLLCWGRKSYPIPSFWIGFMCASRLYFLVFSKMLSVIILKRMEIVLYSVSFCPLK